MRNKLLALLLCLVVLCPYAVTAAAESADTIYTVARVESLCDGIVVYKERQSGADSIQSLIDTGLCDAAGINAEFYAIALSQYGGYDFTSYTDALLRYLSENEIYSASSREKYALALAAAGSNDAYIYDTADEAIGGQGLMSLNFGLHLLSNGYPSALYTADALVGEILSRQLSDGGWAVIGSIGDTDVTAMTVQALAPYYNADARVHSAVDSALSLLSSLQLESGGFMTMGAENCESAAQVVIALSALGIDAQYDERFIKGGVSPMGAMLGYRNDDGSFGHTGGDVNETATMEALCAMIAYLRMHEGRGSLYLLDHCRASEGRPQQPVAPTSASSPQQTKNNRSTSDTKKQAADQKTALPQTDDQQPRTVPSPQQNDPYSGGYPDIVNDALSDDAPNDSANDEIIYENNSAEDAPTSVKGTGATDASQAATATAQTDITLPTTAPTDASHPVGSGGFQPSGGEYTRATGDEPHANTPGGYKLYAVIAILVAAGGAAIFCLIRKKGYKHYLAIVILAAAAIALVLLTNFESSESYHSRTVGQGETTVSMTVRCDTILDDEKVNDYIPDDGVILADTAFSISEGDTVYDVLLQASRTCGLPVDNRGARGAAYIAGINYLYEFAYGDLSGWMYRVNGAFPDVGCQGYHLSDGDKIEWLYTKNIGKDLE